MNVWSTCAECSQELQVVTPGQRFHPACQTSYPTGDQLVDTWLAAVEREDDDAANRLQRQIDAGDHTPAPLGAAAVAYAELGWPVFPLVPGDKIPYPRSSGFKDATTDPALVRQWWTKVPDCNIGIATGHVFDALDIDFVSKAGVATGAAQHWPDVRDSGALPDVHGVAVTPRGGMHVLLVPTGGGNLAGFRPGLDYRGLGGYVVAPPSRRADGARYEWWSPPSPAMRGAAVGEVVAA